MAIVSNVLLRLVPDGHEHHTAHVSFDVSFTAEEITLKTRFRAMVPLFGEDTFFDEHLQTELGETFIAEGNDVKRRLEVSFRVANTKLNEDVFGDDEIYAAVELYADKPAGLELVDRQTSPVVVGDF